uniref:Anti-FecI sigma factor, FecR n=1 Tax=Caulobacter sp. (strain K31) TaxID=366602 RepID=B0SXJ1_CAUSK
MNSTPPVNERQEDPDSAATTWFARLQGDAVLVEDRRAFERWLGADARNAAAWDRCKGVWDRLSLLDSDPALAALRADALGASDASSSRLSRRGLLTAAGVVAMVGSGAAVAWRLMPKGASSSTSTASADPTFTTAVGELSTFHLADGSVVTLSTDSAVKVDPWNRERRLSLLRGQAFFKVAKDAARPFVVAVGDKLVTAVGTAFDVRLDPGKLSVTLLEGRVRIAGPSPRGDRMVEMSAGSKFVAADAADWNIAAVDAVKESSWLQGRLVFDGEPLSAVVAEMNRFSTRKLRVSDPRVAATPVSGVFKTGQVDAFVAAIRSYGLADVGRVDGQEIELIRPRA